MVKYLRLRFIPTEFVIRSKDERIIEVFICSLCNLRVEPERIMLFATSMKKVHGKPRAQLNFYNQFSSRPLSFHKTKSS